MDFILPATSIFGYCPVQRLGESAEQSKMTGEKMLKVMKILMAGLISAPLLVGAAFAQSINNNEAREILIPGIWVDPDGCEHWVMDDGWEGYMSPVILPSGKPVCGRTPNAAPTCGILNSDQFFATDSAALSAAAIDTIKDFFRENRGRVFAIEGHTDSRASDAYNLDLSNRRAQAVADVGKSVRADIRAVRGLGERRPRATNATREGMAMNRRVEIICIR